MMTPKEKAEELVNKYLDATTLYPSGAKKCALIAVDEILRLQYLFYIDNEYEFWNEVKNEIELL